MGDGRRLTRAMVPDMRCTVMRALWLVVGVSCAALCGCEGSECDRLGSRDGKMWLVMDCPASKVRARVTDGEDRGSFEFSCEGDDEHYEGVYFFDPFQSGPLASYAAVINEEDGCRWSQEDGGEDSCVSVDETSYPDGCDESSDTTVVYY